MKWDLIKLIITAMAAGALLGVGIIFLVSPCHSTFLGVLFLVLCAALVVTTFKG